MYWMGCESSSILELIDKIQHLMKTMDSTTVATVVLAFDEKDIENTYDGTGFVIQAGEYQTLPHVLDIEKMAIYYRR